MVLTPQEHKNLDSHVKHVIDVVTAVSLFQSSSGKVVGIYHEYPYLGKGSSIHSPGQMEWFKTQVNDKSIKVPGSQRIETLEGYSFPLSIKEGLPYLHTLGCQSDSDLDNYAHDFFTSPKEWDPSVLDYDFTPDQAPLLSTPGVEILHFDPMHDALGDFSQRVVANLNTFLDHPNQSGEYPHL